jgi:hypothetical protein
MRRDTRRRSLAVPAPPPWSHPGQLLQQTFLTREVIRSVVFLHQLVQHFLRDIATVRKNLAAAWMVGFDGRLFRAPTFDIGTIAAGNLYSTAGDLARFMICLFRDGEGEHGRILSRESLQQMFEVQFSANIFDPQGFGISYYVSRFEGRKMVFHDGAVYGCASAFAALPGEKVGVVVLNTVDCATGLNDKAFQKALGLLLNAKLAARIPPLPQPIDPKGASLNEYAGKYTAPGRAAWVSIGQGELHLLYLGCPCPLSPIGKERFIRDSSGRAMGLKNPRLSLVYNKVPDYQPSSGLPEELGRLCGEYGWPHEIMKVFGKDGQLTCLVEWFFEYPRERAGGAAARPRGAAENPPGVTSFNPAGIDDLETFDQTCEAFRVERGKSACAACMKHAGGERVVGSASDCRNGNEGLQDCPDALRLEPCDDHVGPDRGFQQVARFRGRHPQFARKARQNRIGFENGVVTDHELVRSQCLDQPLCCGRVTGVVGVHAGDDHAGIDPDLHDNVLRRCRSRTRSTSNSFMEAIPAPVSMVRSGPRLTKWRSASSGTMETPSGRGTISTARPLSRPYRSLSSLGITILPAESIWLLDFIVIVCHRKCHLSK